MESKNTSTIVESIDSADKDALPVSAAFNTVASVYDRSFNSSPVIQHLRSKVYREIETRVETGASILDINCGTGIDALYLAGKGMNVVGIDISSNMIEECKKKANEMELKNIEFHVSSFETLSQNFKSKFNLVLSNFGGLNCVRNLDRTAEEIAGLTVPGGYFVAVVMPRFSLWETVTGIASGKWKYALRRLRNGTRATGFNEQSFEVFYHSPHLFPSFFRPRFTVERIVGFNIVSPPPSSTGFLHNYRHLSKSLMRLDELIERIPLIRSMGDHYMIVLKRTAL